MGDMTVNLGHMKDSWANWMASRQLTSDVKLTSNPVSSNDLNPPNDNSVLGPGPNIKFTVSQESSTIKANYNKAITEGVVETEKLKAWALEDQVGDMWSERVQYD